MSKRRLDFAFKTIVRRGATQLGLKGLWGGGGHLKPEMVEVERKKGGNLCRLVT